MTTIDPERVLDTDKIDIPEWLEERNSWTVAEVESINHGGCASGAYMPAVTYHTARETMSLYGDSVLTYIEDAMGELPEIPKGESWSGIACFFLSYAVELWASGVVGAIEDGQDIFVYDPDFDAQPEEGDEDDPVEYSFVLNPDLVTPSLHEDFRKSCNRPLSEHEGDSLWIATMFAPAGGGMEGVESKIIGPEGQVIPDRVVELTRNAYAHAKATVGGAS